MRGTSLPKAVLTVRSTSPPKLTPGNGEEGVRSSQARIRFVPLSSPGSRLVESRWSCFVAGSGKRDRKLMLPLSLPLRFPSV